MEGRRGCGAHAGGGGLWAGGWARAWGGGDAVSSAAERHRVADRGRGAAGAGQSRPGSPGRSWCWGPRSGVGPAPRSAGTNPAEHHPRGRALVEAGGRAPPDGYRGGGRGWAPGLWGPGPWRLWAGAGETGRAPGLRLVRGGVEGPGGLGGEPREALGGWARAPEGGRSLGGGGGVAPCPGNDGGPS